MTTATAPVPAKLQRQIYISPFSLAYPSYLNEKAHLQESRLDAPLGNSSIDHEGRTEAEHNRNKIRQSEGPSRSFRTQSLLGNLGRVGVADCGRAGSRECG